ncbi:MAG: tyrosine--tRNA ligase [Patescibacteria group bacterium]
MTHVNQDKKAIEHFLTRAVENVYPNREAVMERMMQDKPMTVYVGVDPTGPSLHLGHAIEFRKLAELQKLGHKVIMLIGDFTARIGDPTDKTATRKKLTAEEVKANCREYQAQAARILSFDGPNAAEMRFNNDWLGKMSFADVVDLASHFTVQQMLERDMFDRRVKEDKPIYLHEFLYPLMQGYDSVAMDVDMEIGGNDQTFNMLAGRTLMREMKQKEKAVVTCKLLTDASGKKMGKTEGNMITLADTPDDMYGKVMSWTDGMILPGFELCTDVTDKEIKEIEQAIKEGENPMTFKRRLAKEIVAGFVSAKDAEEAEAHFTTVHQKKETPDEVPEYQVADSQPLVDVLVGAGLVPSKTEARRQIEQSGVKVDGDVVTDEKMMVSAGMLIQKGKRFFVKLV